MIPVTPQKAHYLTTSDIQERWIIDDDIHHAPTRLVCLENTLDGEVSSFASTVDIMDLCVSHAGHILDFFFE